MQVYERIRLLRLVKGWSQEEMAHRLDMSLSGYGSIERGEVDVNLSRLQDIAKTFEVDLPELFNLNENNICHVGDNNNHISQINSSSPQAIELKHENEKLALTVAQQEKEIAYLKEIIVLMKVGEQG